MVGDVASQLEREPVGTRERQPSKPTPAEPKAASQRLVSLDAFRGFTMFWIVGGGSLMLGIQHLGSNPIIDFVVYELNHTTWQGLRYYDLIWPCFMLMVGMSVPFSYAKHSLTQSHRQMMNRALKRTVILFLLGSLRTSVSEGTPMLIELSSALQPIAVAYFVAFLLVRTSMKVQAAVGGLILVGYALLLEFVPAPGIKAGSYEIGANLVYFADMAVLNRAHAEGWGTVLSTIPTISTTILGLWIGGLLRSERSSASKMKIIGLVGLGGVVLGMLLNPVIPGIRKLWTTSYGILSAGWACLLFLLFYWIIDVRCYRRWSVPLVVIGMNAVAIYLAGTLIPIRRIVGIFTAVPAATLGPSGLLFQAICVFVVEWLILYWMYKRKIFLRA
jgi:predicted acyltransferase